MYIITISFKNFLVELPPLCPLSVTEIPPPPPPPDLCQSGEYFTSGSISSPLHPENYPDFMDCTWNLTVGYGKVSFH